MADPFTSLRDALAGSSRLVGVKILLGEDTLALAGAPSRVVLVPVGGPLMPPEDKDNFLDENVKIDCHCWAADFGKLWVLKSALILAVQDYRLTSSVDVQLGDVDYTTSGDTSAQGRPAIVSINLRVGIDATPLPAAAGTGTVNAIQYTRGA